jgi:hypothetical protein
MALQAAKEKKKALSAILKQASVLQATILCGGRKSSSLTINLSIKKCKTSYNRWCWGKTTSWLIL